VKIFYDHQIFSTQHYGGVSRYFYEVAKRLSRQDECDVEIFAPLYINEYLGNNSGIRVRGKKILKPPHAGGIIRMINSALTSRFVTTDKSIDIFHETYFTRTDRCPPFAKRIITVYDMIHEKFPHYFSGRDRTPGNKAHAVHRADHVICISENTRQDLIELLDVPEEKTSVVYLGHSLACRPGSIQPANVTKPFILYVGSRIGYKNFDLLLRAFSSSRSLQRDLSIICFGGGKASPDETIMTGRLGLPSDCVTYINGDDTVLADLYASARAFVCPSLYEGFGIPPLEAMSFGCPVICANTGSLPEVVGEAALLFDPTSESSLRTAMETVIFSPAHAGRLKEKGLERIRMFSWEKCALDTLNVYKKTLGMI